MKKINYIIISALFAILPYTSRLKAQTIAVKSDLLTGALSSPNLSAEVKLSERFTLEAGFHYNPFSIGRQIPEALVCTTRIALLDASTL